MLPILQRRVRRVVSFASLASLATIVACDIPSEAPIFQQTWIVPSDSVTVDAAEIAPNGVLVTAGAPPAFEFTTPSANIATTLADVCGQPACQTAVTVTVPTPAFTSPDDEMTATIAFPAGVTAATVTGGAFNLAITNNLGFDPLRPNGAGSAPYGTLSMSVTSGAVTANYVITGSPTVGLPHGATTPLVLQLPTGTYTGSVRIELALNVPAGNPATINGSNGLEIAASIQGLRVTQTTVALVNETVNTEATEFDLEDIDFADEVEGGALLLTTVNPFTASAQLDVVIVAPPQQDGRPQVTITKTITIPAQPTSTATVTLSKAEMASLLGKGGVTMRVNGAVNGTGPGGTLVLTPTSRIIVRTQLQLILNIGA
jgi:hypothetical protein